MVEAIQTKKKTDLHMLIDSRCTRICIDEEFAHQQGWPLEKS
jgi:hypothetical protein